LVPDNFDVTGIITEVKGLMEQRASRKFSHLPQILMLIIKQYSQTDNLGAITESMWKNCYATHRNPELDEDNNTKT
jgi:hypothetical protein